MTALVEIERSIIFGRLFEPDGMSGDVADQGAKHHDDQQDKRADDFFYVRHVSPF